jgi:biotin operon repressor
VRSELARINPLPKQKSARFGQLPTQQRVIVLRRFQHGVSITEISEDLGISERAVQKTIERARVNCQKVLRSRHGNGWTVPCLLVIQQPDTVAPIAPSLTVTGATGSVLSSTAKVGLGLAAGLLVALPILLPKSEVEAANQGSPPGAIASQTSGSSTSGLLAGFQPDQVVRIGANPHQPESASAASTRFTVHVHDHAGSPIAGAPILTSEVGALGSSLTLRPSEYFEADGSPRPGSTPYLTDASGRAEVDLRIHQETQLLAAHPDYVVLRESIVPVDGGRKEVRLILEPAARVDGRVVDRQGLPVANVVVAAHPSDRGVSGHRKPEFRAVSDANGEFRMVALAPGDYQFRLTGSATATFWSESTELAVGANSTQLEIRRGSSVYGEVLDPEGKPLQNASVCLVRKDEVAQSGQTEVPPRDIPQVQVDPETGRFELHNALSDGREQLLVRARGYQTLRPALANPGEFQSIVLQKSSLSLEVHVLAEGSPADDALVSLSWNHGNGWNVASRSQLSSAGKAHFELESVAPGTRFDLTVIHAQGSAFLSSQVVRASHAQLQVDLQSGTPVTVRMVDATGQPVPYFEINASAELVDPGAMNPLSVRFIADANGECTWCLPDATLHFSPQMAGVEQRFLSQEPLVVSGGAPMQREIVLHKRFARSFRVLDGDNQPIADRTIRFRAPDGSILYGGQTRAEGMLLAQDLIPGSYTPLLSPSYTPFDTDRVAVGDPVDLAASDNTEPLPLRFPALHALKLRLELPAGQAMPKTFALVPHSPIHQDFALLAYAHPTFAWDENGEADLSQLVDGNYWLMLPKQEDRPAVITSLQLPIASDEFVWRVAGTRLQGRLQTHEITGLEGKTVSLLPVVSTPAGVAMDTQAAALPSIKARFDREGHFAFPFVPSGEWEIFATGLGAHAILRQRVQIPPQAGEVTDLGALQAIRTGALSIELGEQLRSRLSSRLAIPRPGTFALLNLDSQTWFRLVPDEDGMARRDDLPAGTYQLHVFGEPVEAVQSVLAGKTTVLRVD